jgi:hypothetical protein
MDLAPLLLIRRNQLVKSALQIRIETLVHTEQVGVPSMMSRVRFKNPIDPYHLIGACRDAGQQACANASKHSSAGKGSFANSRDGYWQA